MSGICGSNLHSAWDTCLVLKAVGEDVGGAATELIKTITPAQLRAGPIRIQSTRRTIFAIAEEARTECSFERVRPVSIHRAK